MSGLLASFLLLVQLVLMARLPLVERAYGQERLARTHRLVGFASFTLMIAHVGLLVGRLAVSSPKRRSPTAPTVPSAAPGAG